MKIITISREFGSGGRELGKRLADILNFAYYDKEIVTAIAEQNQLNENYVEKRLENKFTKSYPITFGRTFYRTSVLEQNTTKLLVAQQHIIKELAAQGENCVIVGRNADILLHDFCPLNLFVYAEMKSKIKRCRYCASENEQLSDREIEKKIKQIDANRAKHRELISNSKWGQKESYHLCINTTDWLIKELAPLIENYSQYWFRRTEQ